MLKDLYEDVGAVTLLGRKLYFNRETKSTKIKRQTNKKKNKTGKNGDVKPGRELESEEKDYLLIYTLSGVPCQGMVIYL